MRRAGRRGRWLLSAVNAAIYLYILAPVLIVIAISFSAAAVTTFPPRGFSLKWYGKFLANPDLLASMRLSIILAVETSLIATLVGVLAAFGVVRGRFPGRAGVQAFFLSPLMVPALVTAIALLQFYVRLGIATGAGLVLGHLVITLPYVIRTVSASLANFDMALERAAISLGATELQALRRVTLRVISPGILAGALFAFIVSFENLPVSLLISDPDHISLPVRIFTYMEWVFDPTVAAASGIQVLVVLAVIVLLEKGLGVSRVLELE